MSKVKKKKAPRDVVSKEDYYMGMAFMVSSRSKDPSTQVGSIIIGENNVPVSSGYNGVPRKMNDTDVDWGRNDKYDLIDHAEENALFHARWYDLTDATVYVTALPCKRCMRALVRHGIGTVIYYPMPFKSGSMLELDERDKERILEIAKFGKVKVEEFKGNLNWMRDQLATFESWGIFT